MSIYELFLKGYPCSVIKYLKYLESLNYADCKDVPGVKGLSYFGNRWLEPACRFHRLQYPRSFREQHGLPQKWKHSRNPTASWRSRARIESNRVYRRITCTDRYLNFDPDHSNVAKMAMQFSLYPCCAFCVWGEIKECVFTRARDWWEIGCLYKTNQKFLGRVCLKHLLDRGFFLLFKTVNILKW